MVTPGCKDISGLSWGVPHKILQTLSHISLQRCPTTLLECPSWNPLDTKSDQPAGNSSGIFTVGSFIYQITPACRDIPELFLDVPYGILRTPSHTRWQGHPRSPGLSWDVTHGILRTPSHTRLCPRGVLAPDHAPAQVFHLFLTIPEISLCLEKCPTLVSNLLHFDWLS